MPLKQIKQNISIKSRARKASPKSLDAMLARKDISPLGRKLLAIRREIEHADLPLLSDKEVMMEHNIRRGGSTMN